MNWNGQETGSKGQICPGWHLPFHLFQFPLPLSWRCLHSTLYSSVLLATCTKQVSPDNLRHWRHFLTVSLKPNIFNIQKGF